MSEIKYYDLSVQAYEKIKSMILTNELKPGEKIRQENIAARLGVSRTPLHKAFQMLENEFLVESVPRRGIFVKNIDFTQIKDAFECREVLEGLAARRLAEIITDKQLNDLRKLFDPFLNKEVIDENEYRKADEKFHKFIMLWSGNSILVRIPKNTLSEHIEIIEAFAAKNGEKAEELMRKHSRKAIENIESIINKSKI